MAIIRGQKRNRKTQEKADLNAPLPSPGAPINRSSDWWENFSRRFSGYPPDSLFKVSRKTFEYICGLVEEEMMTGQNCTDLRREYLMLNDRVAMALTRLCTGKSLDAIGNMFRVSISTVSLITWRFVEAIEKKGFHHLHWPKTEEQIMEIKSKFERIRGLPNCCGAIDTTKIMFCLSSDHAHRKIWRDSENDACMILQAVVDPDMRFLDIIAGLPGSLSEPDVLCEWSLFNLCEERKRLNGKKLKLAENKEEIGEYIVGSGGFPLLPWLLTPYKQEKKLCDVKEDFNKRHYVTWKVAKMAFERLKENWQIIQGVLWTPDKHKLPRIIYACCVLHNIMIEQKDGFIMQDQSFLQSDDNSPQVHQQKCKFRDKTASVQRDNLALYLSTLPPFSSNGFESGTMDKLALRSQLARRKTTGEVKRAAELKGVKTSLPMVDLQTGAAGASGSQVVKSTRPPVVEKTVASRTLKQSTLTKPPAGDKKKRAVVEEIDPAGDGSGEQDPPPTKKSRTDDPSRKEAAEKSKISDKGKFVADETVSAGTKVVVPFAGVPVGPGGCPAAWLDREFMRQQPLDLPKARTISRGIADVPPLRHFRWGLPNDIQLEIGRGIADRVVLADQADPRRAFLGSIDALWGLYGATVSMVGTGLAQFINDYRSTISESANVGKELSDTKKALAAANEVSAGLRGRLNAAESENEKLRSQLAEANKVNSELVEQSKSVDRTMEEMKQKVTEAQAHWEAEQAVCADLRKQLEDLGSSVQGQIKVASKAAADDGFMMGYDQGFYHIARCVLAHDGGTPDLDVLEEWILTHPFSNHLRDFHPRIPFSDIELQRYVPMYDPDWVAPAVDEANLRERVRRATEAREAAAEEGEQAGGEVEQSVESTVEPTKSETNADQMLHHSLREENVHNEEMRHEGS